MIVTASARARADLASIWAYVAQDDPVAADRLIDRIIAATDRLARFPESGTPRPEIGSGARSLSIGRYFILYRINPRRVEIVRVLHGARDILRILDG